MTAKVIANQDTPDRDMRVAMVLRMWASALEKGKASADMGFLGAAQIMTDAVATAQVMDAEPEPERSEVDKIGERGTAALVVRFRGSDSKPVSTLTLEDALGILLQ